MRATDCRYSPLVNGSAWDEKGEVDSVLACSAHAC